MNILNNTYISILLLSFSITAASQDLLPKNGDGKIVYENVISIDGVTKDQLYKRALEWFLFNFNSETNVIDIRDQEAGKLIARGADASIEYFSRNPIIRFTIQVLVKDGKYRYIISELTYTDDLNATFPLETFPSSWVGKKKLHERVDEKMKQKIVSLNKAMSSKTKSEEDW